jgi:hypothetical protein
MAKHLIIKRPYAGEHGRALPGRYGHFVDSSPFSIYYSAKRNPLRQAFDFLFHLPVHLLQQAPSIRGMRQQRQEGDLRLLVVALQTRTAS